MKKNYFVVSINENGKKYAYMWIVPSCNNLINSLDIKNAEFILLAETKKKASEIATTWNNGYKENKCYMFDYEEVTE